MKKISLFVAAVATVSCTAGFSEQVVTTQDKMWVSVDPKFEVVEGQPETLTVDLKAVGQTIQGFGTAFSELSYDALSYLSEEDRTAIYEELFAPGAGASFTINRTPLGANDFSRDYYSYDDVDGDLALEHFSIEHDRSGLIPEIKAALAQNPDLKIWASPWCPPQWMKTNKHYATTVRRPSSVSAAPQRLQRGPGGPQGGFGGGMPMTPEMLAQIPEEFREMAMRSMGGQQPDRNGVIEDTGIKPEQYGREGMDMFTQEPEYLQAYAKYFRKYVEAYRAEGIDIYMVMPQNEPNSAQWYPSCVWTAQGLLNFQKYLVPEMEEIGVQVMHGTMERPDYKQVDTVLRDPEIGHLVKGAAFQWGGSEALPKIHELYPDLTMVMSEHQCHSGQNSWADFIDSWDLLKFYLDNGVSIYDYWNLALCDRQVSSWGWSQNSLICVNKQAGTYKYNYEYYLMKHISRYVKPGAVYLGTSGTLTEALAFRNPDGEIVVLAAEKDGTARNLELQAGSKKLHVYLPENSLSTIVL